MAETPNMVLSFSIRGAGRRVRAWRPVLNPLNSGYAASITGRAQCRISR